jgi:hypothetical protein
MIATEGHAAASTDQALDLDRSKTTRVQKMGL